MPMYNSFKQDIMTGAIQLSADTVPTAAAPIKVILLSASYTPNIDTDSRYFHLSAHEISIADPGRTVGYSTTGLWLSGALFGTDLTNDRASLSANNSTWNNSTITARYAALVKVRGGTKDLDNLVGYVDFLSNQSSSNGAFTIAWNTAGVILFT